MIIYTSYFKLFDKVPNPVPISIGKPKGIITTKELPGLAPTWDIVLKQRNMEINNIEYIKLYIDLVFNKRFFTVENITNAIRYYYSSICTLLCWENPSCFCHRHIISYILNTFGNCKCAEWETPIEKVYQLNETQKSIIYDFFITENLLVENLKSIKVEENNTIIKEGRRLKL